ncbi:hypothetical protein H7992_21620 [Sporosarcina sp. resist]|uniref:hypothetical protein n=1 Tax=Sporosarcina sp. resist TaxID=2762563 RepID=UPI00164E3B3F|nr:hypothetical protein [Sporosarcina sp. resist]QNK87735.1 hypothetical protein H7992_21620 [Sporosarcina sp. resist]
MKDYMVRKLLPNGDLGPLEPAFPEVVNIDPAILMLTEAIAGLQEQVILQQVEIDELKGGGE